MTIRTTDAKALSFLLLVAALLTGLAYSGLSSAAPKKPKPAEEFAQLIEAEVQSWTPTWYPEGKGPETPEERKQRRAMAADVIHSVSLQGDLPFWPADTMALLATIWKYESGSLDWHVHGGEVSPIGHADHRTARCLGQIHYVANWWTREEWEALEGRDREATMRCARATLRILAYHAKRCRMREAFDEVRRWRAPLEANEAAALFSGYADGHSCQGGGRGGRVQEWARIRQLFF